MPELDQIVGATGWLTVIVIAILSMMRGWLVPLTIVNKLEAYYKSVIADKDEQISQWRNAYYNSDRRADQFLATQQTILETVRTNNAAVQALAEKVDTPKSRSA